MPVKKRTRVYPCRCRGGANVEAERPADSIAPAGQSPGFVFSDKDGRQLPVALPGTAELLDPNANAPAENPEPIPKFLPKQMPPMKPMPQRQVAFGNPPRIQTVAMNTTKRGSAPTRFPTGSSRASRWSLGQDYTSEKKKTTSNNLSGGANKGYTGVLNIPDDFDEDDAEDDVEYPLSDANLGFLTQAERQRINTDGTVRDCIKRCVKMDDKQQAERERYLARKDKKLAQQSEKRVQDNENAKAVKEMEVKIERLKEEKVNLREQIKLKPNGREKNELQDRLTEANRLLRKCTNRLTKQLSKGALPPDNEDMAREFWKKLATEKRTPKKKNKNNKLTTTAMRYYDDPPLFTDDDDDARSDITTKTEPLIVPRKIKNVQPKPSSLGTYTVARLINMIKEGKVSKELADRLADMVPKMLPKHIGYSERRLLTTETGKLLPKSIANIKLTRKQLEDIDTDGELLPRIRPRTQKQAPKPRGRPPGSKNKQKSDSTYNPELDPDVKRVHVPVEFKYLDSDTSFNDMSNSEMKRVRAEYATFRENLRDFMRQDGKKLPKELEEPSLDILQQIRAMLRGSKKGIPKWLLDLKRYLEMTYSWGNK